MRRLAKFCRYIRKLELSFQKSIGKPQTSGRSPSCFRLGNKSARSRKEKLISVSQTSRHSFGERIPPARFNVVIMYEDPGTRKQAKKGT